MYSTCLHCGHALGANEVIEHFPVGRRLAFDAARGRLWVVCMACRRWNLTPMEERWEAIEAAERLFRDTRLRVSTGEIGLARLREGLELVRVGEPLRPEIAAWRYGEQFGARRRRHIIIMGGIAVAGAAAAAGGAYLGAGVIAISQLGSAIWQVVNDGYPRATIARFRIPGEGIIRIQHRDLSASTLHQGPDGGLAMTIAHSGGRGRLHVTEGDARMLARQIFPRINRRGATADEVSLAVGRLERAGDAEAFLARTARSGGTLAPAVPLSRHSRWFGGGNHDANAGLLALSGPLGLAIEMALNEEQERRALEGELAELEVAWKEAEEIGAIADSMFLPESVEQAWRRMRGDAGPNSVNGEG